MGFKTSRFQDFLINGERQALAEEVSNLQDELSFLNVVYKDSIIMSPPLPLKVIIARLEVLNFFALLRVCYLAPRIPSFVSILQAIHIFFSLPRDLYSNIRFNNLYSILINQSCFI